MKRFTSINQLPEIDSDKFNTMKTKHIFGIFKSLMLLLLIMLSTLLMAQQTVVKGVVTDIRTHETMPGVSVSFDGTSTGTSADLQGNYKLSTDGNVSRIKVSFIGYKTIYKDVTPGVVQTINVAMGEDRRALSEVVIKSGKKTRYTN